MSSSPPEPAQIIASARQLLAFAQQGYRDFLDAGERQQSGIYNLVSAARSAHFALLRLKGKVEGFDEWWSEVTTQMAADPVFVWFKTLRNKMEKQGEMGGGSAYLQASFSPHELLALVPPLTDGAYVEALQVGDPQGRSSAVIAMPDGTREILYLKLPDHIAVSRYVMEDAPDHRDFGDLAHHYLSVLDQIVSEAESRWK